MLNLCRAIMQKQRRVSGRLSCPNKCYMKSSAAGKEQDGHSYGMRNSSTSVTDSQTE